MTPLFAFFKLLRPLNLFLGTITVLISASILHYWHTTTIVKAVLTVVSLNAAANAFNDYRDFDSDKINRADRPLPSGSLSKNSALMAAVILFLCGIILSVFINFSSFVIASLISAPLMIIYSIWLKGRPLIGNLVVAAILGLAFLFAGTSFGNPQGLVVPALLAFGFNFLREIVKDIADVEGDRAAHLNTFPVKFGVQPSVRLVLGLCLLMGSGFLIPFFMDIYGYAYLIILILGIEIPLLFIVSSLVKSPSIKTCKTSSQILKVCILSGLFAVYLG
ncbi:MAG: geranylgeranylglycerol-phosphate geranylgeranyltransferase [Candidatus Marinimicrobia bacterium]|nr:geranylgeranylglycerol-phosphate geranylgeranyltransferase [Candidatus Neomarinimicrobiota bacterium]MDP6592853.1 geranylgeranylglycerol-phosphate geranylgeranyltransferase [Candidatus Neomarinimicrobiota bacterium]MDP6835874.1 geranylgeranylglycerol-phosphate geranylgeranyltransferase [Candidatus Neomarinimicrobiota bacterium]